MKIEKISDTQIKIFLTREDLLQRDLMLSELTYNSEKAQALFREIMEQALIETGFEVNAAPLVIEAMPVSMDGIMVIVTKIIDEKNEGFVSPFSEMLKRLSQLGKEDITSNFYNTGVTQSSNSPEGKRYKLPKNIAIYSFDDIDDVSSAAARISVFFRGASSLYKYDGKYFICLQLPYKTAYIKMGELENVLGEYGERHVSNNVSRGFLLEHGEILINSNAVNKLASI